MPPCNGAQGGRFRAAALHGPVGLPSFHYPGGTGRDTSVADSLHRPEVALRSLPAL